MKRIRFNAKKSMLVLIAAAMVFDARLVEAGSWSYQPVAPAPTQDANGAVVKSPEVLYGNNEPGVNQYRPTIYTPPAAAKPAPSASPATNNNMPMVMGIAAAALPALMSGMGRRGGARGTTSPTNTNASAGAPATVTADAGLTASPASSASKGSSARSMATGSADVLTTPDPAGEARAGACGSSEFAPPMDNIRATSCFASARDGGSRRHKGLDLNTSDRGRGASGAGVKAVANGKVRAAGNMGGRSGPTVIMDHVQCPKTEGRSIGSNCISTYRHLSRTIKVRQGNCYDKGTVIGSIGSQGENGGVVPHLHIEIATQSRAYNPAAFAAIIPLGANLGQCDRRANTLAHGSGRAALGARARRAANAR
jgi:murein DD-endopeptidase MepM/ murein hydrolase activator NlpD